MSFKMNELKARMKNRVESNYLCWKLTQIEREKTCHLVQCNKQLSEIKSDLKSIKTSTGTIRKPSVSVESGLDNRASSSKSRSSSNDDDDSYSRRGTLIDYTSTRENDEDRPLYTNDTIEDLKKKDPVLIKRLKQMEVFKRSGRAPYFDEHHDELKPPKVIFSKASLTRQKSELCEETRRSAMLIPHENYDTIYQVRLKPQIDLFIQRVNMVK